MSSHYILRQDENRRKKRDDKVAPECMRVHLVRAWVHYSLLLQDVWDVWDVCVNVGVALVCSMN